MGLRTTPDDSPRLSPEEARAFLQIHAEREAGGLQAAPDAPTVESLAELLHLSPEETRSILAEARSRVSASVVRPKRTFRREGFLAAGLLAVTLFFLSTLLLTSRTTPAASPLALSQTAPMTPATQIAKSAGPPAGWEIEVAAEGYRITVPGEPAKFGTDFRKLSAPETAALRERLVDATLDLLDNMEGGSRWAGGRTLSVGYRVVGGAWTRLIVPLKPFTFPFAGNPGGRADLRTTLDRTTDAGWNSIVKAMPQ